MLIPGRRINFFGSFGAWISLLLLVIPARAHVGADAVFAAPPPPADTVPLISVTGATAELIVDNRVANTVTRYVVLKLDEGRKLALDGAASGALEGGARVEALGRAVGNTLFVTRVNVIAGAPRDKALSGGATGSASAQGTLSVVHADYFAQGRGEYTLVVQGADGTATPLEVAVIPDSLRAGMSVIATGSIAANGFSLDASNITILAMPPADFDGPAEAPTTNNVLVMPIKFTDSPASDAFSGDTINTEFQTRVAPFYQEQSFGAQLLNVTVACNTTVPAGCATHASVGGWLLAGAATPANCNYTSVASLADSAAQAAGYVLSNYRNRFYIMPYNSVCGWSGLAYVGSPYQAWGNGYYQLWVSGHELGHNFTLWHAGSLYCPGQSIGSNCVGNYSVNEYGDPFDVMGNVYPGHFNAMQKSKLNWLPAGSVKTHSSGTASYTLSPLESPGQATYAVKIPAASNRTYWIEYRQPIGFDGGFSSNGAQVRVASPFEFPCTNCGADDTEMLDMSLGTPANFGDGALLPGQSYTDSQNGITLNVTSVVPGSNGSLTLSVSIGGATATSTSLTSSLNPSLFGTSVTFTGTVSGSAPTGTVAFTSDGSTIAGCGAVGFSAGSANAPSAFCSTSILAAGTHNIVASYSGDSGNIASSSPVLAQVVNSGVPPSSWVNPSFEIPALSGSYQYTPSGPGVGWSFVGGSGIQGNGSAWGAATAPNGTQTAFFQGTGSMSQALTLSAGSYTLSFQAAQRWCCVAPYVQPVRVSLDGSQIGLVSPASTSFGLISISFSVAATGAHTLSFSGTDASDKTTFIDNVSLTSAGVASTTILASSANPVNAGAMLTFTATVNGLSPSGTVAFMSDGSTIAGCEALSFSSGSVNAPTAACNTNSLATGTHSIVASYSGDAGNTASSSPALQEQVTSSSSLLNTGFEIPALGPSYQYTPSAPGVGWSFVGGAGIQGNGSAFGAASAPEGTQSAFIQGTGSMSQTLSLTAGSYTLSFQAAQRWCCVAPYVQPVRVSLDGAQIDNLVSPASTSFGPVTISFSVATTGAHTLSFTGTDPTDKTTFVDGISLVSNASFVNASFETPALGAGYQYAPSSPGIGWSFIGGAGIQGNGSVWIAALAPDGSQTAFIQGTGSMSQAISLNAGSYTLSFQAAQRICCVPPYLQPVRVSIDGTPIGNLVTPASASFGQVSISFSLPSSGIHTFNFAGTDPTDKSTFIDSVTIQ